ncbi:MAG TPA: cytochrome c [Polyangiaceae bacterium]
MAGVLCVLPAVGGCRERPYFSAPLVLASGVEVSPDVLNEGRRKYRLYCARCHGESGDGHGMASSSLPTAPRDLTRAEFKLAGTAGKLPDDRQLVELVRTGMFGTAMPAFDIPESERLAIVQYTKTFSQRWQNEPPRRAAVSSEER